MLILIHMNTHTHKNKGKKGERGEREEEREGEGRGLKRGKRKGRTGMGERLMRFIDFEQSEISKFCSKSQYTNPVLKQPIKVLFSMSEVLLIPWEASLRH